MNSAGAVTSEDSYDAYGEKITTNGNPDPFGYHGEDGYYTDSDTGLIYLQHRYYDPGTGRFLNRDPAGYAGGSDLYAYCENGPVDGSDPSGLASDLPEWILEHSQSEFDAPGEECPPAADPEYSLSGQEEMDGEVQGMGVGSADYDATFGEQVVTDGYAADCPGTPTGKPGWKVGDDIYKPTAKGNEPKWSTIRARFWKNKAADPSSIGKFNDENLSRMDRGLAPWRYNLDKGGMESMELSHEPIPYRDGGRGIEPRWPQEHADIDSQRRPGY